MPQFDLTSFFQGPAFLIIMVVAMFALMILPQRKREKKVKNMLGALKAGDRIKTIGGFYGTIVNIKEDVVTIAVGPDKVKLTIVRNAIAGVEDGDVENTMEQQAS